MSSKIRARETETIGKLRLYNGQAEADMVRTADPDGLTVVQLRILENDPIDIMYRKGGISNAQYAAGCKFRNDFERAALRGRYARVNDVGGGSGGGFVELIDGDSQCYAAFKAAIAAIATKPDQDLVWSVIGRGLSLRQYCEIKKKNGTPLGRRTATKGLIRVLDRLVGHYGFE